ncbi:uncharacterized protein LOC122641834 [Telopea speciosissima]|uniref:uncharacterized protein LOC122641834 n=1 Tax=Telopea speciosissima TaxID=54955 RepID=UPI001CC5B14A|nr:uncharacterized protein LOC122641834 [Telopea speciosissima]
MEDEREILIRKTNKVFNRCISNAGDELCSFRSCLRWMCLDQSSIWRSCLSWSLFLLLAIIVPLLSHFVLACPTCDARHHRPYDGVVQLSLTVVATLSFFCLSRFVRTYGLRRFLFLDKLCEESEKVGLGYTEQFNRSWKLLLVFILPCFAVESAYKIWWFSSAAIPFLGSEIVSDAVACTLELCSWLYRTSIIFFVCILFRLLCYLQILRLQDFAEVFQVESDVASILKEHLRIRRHLRIISHRYRVFIIFALLCITASQLASLLIITRSNSVVTIFTAGELALCSITLVTGLFICLRSATKITHKAQAVTCLAAKWHVCATIESFDGGGTDSETPVLADYEVARPHVRDFPINSNGEWEDEENADGENELDNTNIIMPIYARTISFHKRQALVTYFENNKAGITVFGFVLDRSCLHTIFAVEMSLVLWLLSKTIGIS